MDIRRSAKMLKACVKNFVRENNFVTLSSAFIIGQTTNKFLSSFIVNIIMPFIRNYTKFDNITRMTIPLGITKMNIGNFIGDLIYFILTIFIVCLFVEYVMHRMLAEKATAVLTDDDRNAIDELAIKQM